MEKPWFKNKRFGWGWHPITLEGFLLTMAFSALYVLGIGLYVKVLIISENKFLIATIILILYLILITKLIIFICTKKGGKPRWNWS